MHLPCPNGQVYVVPRGATMTLSGASNIIAHPTLIRLAIAVWFPMYSVFEIKYSFPQNDQDPVNLFYLQEYTVAFTESQFQDISKPADLAPKFAATLTLSKLSNLFSLISAARVPLFVKSVPVFDGGCSRLDVHSFGIGVTMNIWGPGILETGTEPLSAIQSEIEAIFSHIRRAM